MPSFSIRPFAASDGMALALIHRRAIRALAGGDYSAADCESWSSGIDPRAYVRIAAEDETFEVAVMDHGPVAGFCSHSVREDGPGEICGLFVDPLFQGCGVGRALMRSAETYLIGQGVAAIEIGASLNGEPFYRSFGFERVAQAKISTRGGRDITISKMRRRVDHERA
jgi:ribosomal protein S18 acetylase RimI-like enzyme